MFKLFRIVKLLGVFFALMVSARSEAFLDFLVDHVEKIAETSAMIDAASDLLDQVDENNSLSRSLDSVQNSTQVLESDIRELHYLPGEVSTFLNESQWVNGRLDQNIKKTSFFIRQGKNLLLKATLLGNDGVTAVNGIQTNVSLNEIQKNQQTLIAQNQQIMTMRLSEKVKEEKSWTDFINTQRAIRNGDRK